MIRRGVLGLDRTLAALLGLVLVAVGAAAAVWAAGWPPALARHLSGDLSTGPVTDVLQASWWAWVALLAGVVLALLGLWWLLAHVPRSGVGMLGLAGTRRTGRLLIDPTAATRTAADVLEDARGVRSASGHVLRVGGHVVLELRAVVDAHADLPAVAAACDAVADDLHAVVGREEVSTRVRLSVSRRSDSSLRVR